MGLVCSLDEEIICMFPFATVCIYERRTFFGVALLIALKTNRDVFRVALQCALAYRRKIHSRYGYPEPYCLVNHRTQNACSGTNGSVHDANAHD